MSNARNFLQTCCSYCALVRFGLLLFCLWCVCNLVAINLLFQKCKTIIHSMEFLLQSHYGNGTGHIDHAHRVTLGSIKSFVSVVIRGFPAIILMSVYVWFVLNLRTKVELTRSNAFATLSVRILRSELNVDISTVIVPSHPSSLCIEVSQQCELNNGFIFLRMLTPHARGATQVG